MHARVADQHPRTTFHTVSEGRFCELRPNGVLRSCAILAAFSTIGAPAPVGSVRERSVAVYARVSTLEGSPEQIDKGLRYLREEILPTARMIRASKDCSPSQ